MSVPSQPRFDASGIRPVCSDQTLEFYWSPPASADQTGYTLSCPTDPSSPYTFGSTETYTKITGLTNGQEYAYQITADNGNGSSAPAFYRSVQPGLKPGGPINPYIAFQNVSTAIVSFTPAASNGGATIKWYFAKALSTNPSDPIIKYDCEGFRSTISLTNLNPASDYRFTVYSVNDPGYSLGISYEIIQSGLLIWLDATSYSGSGTWYDQTSNHFDTTLENGIIAKNAAGNGIVLNGSTSWQFPYIGAQTNWTVSVWFKRNYSDFNARWASIVTQIGNGPYYSQNTINITLTALTYGSDQYAGGFASSGGQFRIGAYIPFPVGVWENMVVTWDGTYIKTYFNNSLIEEKNYSGQTSPSSGKSYVIGRFSDISNIGTSGYVTGEIGELLIYNRALTAADVSYNYSISAPIYA